VFTNQRLVENMTHCSKTNSLLWQWVPAAALLAGALCIARAENREAQSDHIVKEGIAVEFSVFTHSLTSSSAHSQVRQGADVRVQFKIRDTTTDSPVTGLNPAAWIHPADKSESVERKVRSFLSGSLSQRARIDLNTFYVLAMNEDATISVIDPISGYGGSKLLTMVMLQSPGDDWVLTRDQKRLFVSMPASNQIAVVNPATWRVVTNISTGTNPHRMALQEDGGFLWVTRDDGVTAVNVQTLEVAARIPTGAGPHSLALSDDDRFVFVANSSDNSVSIIDAQALKLLRCVATPGKPVSAAYSTLAKSAYFVLADQNAIIAVDGETDQIGNRIDCKPGLSSIRIAPGGRTAFAVNPEQKELLILDLSENRVVQTVETKEKPDQVFFSDRLAYVRSLDSEMVLMIQLELVGQEGRPVPISEFPAGEAPLGRGAGPSAAAGIVPSYEAGAVLVASPLEQTIHYYREGMAAPMGTFKNYGRQPRAVLVVDRSLREVSPGIYAADLKLPSSGTMDVAFLLNSPRIVHCFALEIQPDPELAGTGRNTKVRVEPQIAKDDKPEPGREFQVRFKLTNPDTGDLITGIEDLVGVISSPGNWHNREMARAVAPGVYELAVIIPRSGAYFINLQSASLNLRVQDLPAYSFRAGSVERKSVNR
jgi:YVTN family beta-propeller protein